jgi:predicted lipid-binding transport protein (Tim44 family)
LDQGFLEIAVLAFVAAFILFRLYSTLGKRTGAPPPEPRPQPAQGPMPTADAALRPTTAPVAAGKAGEGLMDIVRADQYFEPDRFVTGAKAAYELIVGAFAKGDLVALKPLLSQRLYDLYADAIAKRTETNGVGPELVRLRNAEIVDATMDGSTAKIGVKFEAELAEGAHGVRDAREKWTFERDVRSNDQNWVLSRVVQA